jgi:hypothetical protein
MALPRIVVRGRKLILLNGFKDAPKTPATSSRPVIIAEDKFQKPSSGILMQLPSATLQANGSRPLSVSLEKLEQL